MTNRENKLKSMLNYYGIDMVSEKDEKMTKSQKKEFFNKFNSSYDSQIVQEIFEKMRDKMDNPDEENVDPFFDSLNNDKDNLENGFAPLDMDSFSNKKNDSNNSDRQNFSGFNPGIEEFIGWVKELLYSSDHKVVIKEEGDNITHIRLEKIKKKRGGRRK